MEWVKKERKINNNNMMNNDCYLTDLNDKAPANFDEVVVVPILDEQPEEKGGIL